MIIIVGGGLAGLSLGQGLKQANIPFRIYERDTHASFRAQGYRIRISSDGAAALKKLFPPRLYDAFEATCAKVVLGGHAVNAATGVELEFHLPGGRGSPQHAGKSHNADRAVLRNLLLHGLEGYVEFGKKMERYELNEGGGVTAHFSDGSIAEGDLLIGADGVRSSVRRQLLPDFKILDTEGRPVFGKTLVSDPLTTQLPKQIGNGLTLAYKEDEPRMKLFTDGMAFDRTLSTEYEHEMDLKVPADYIYWVLLFRKDVLPDEHANLLSLSGHQSVEKSLELTESWHHSLRVLLEEQIPDAASTLAFLTSTPSFGSDWEAQSGEGKGRVTLMGDAAHPMPPVGGIGANAGFQDSAALFAALRDASEPSGRGEQVVMAHQKAMLERAQPVVDMSAGGAGRFFGMKPMDELKPAELWH
ncbi:uncharacterized protein LTR77_004065 [Saxophila tyrrhenica]|uniref:FAD-binding domain-containing protein n=1 Tax=Saxophila tyrrhenica TaxID=1690608 RepID=A0AAV9PBQ1_9PEZI|nr:hypothetical protein LTR77_004065 [Saxophila tyrrhenica]